MKLMKWLIPLILVGIWACGGKAGPPTTAQAAAKAWFQAALAGDEAGLSAVSVDSEEAKLKTMASKIKTDVSAGAAPNWQATTTSVGDKAWIANASGYLITFHAKKVGDHWEIIKVETSD